MWKNKFEGRRATNTLIILFKVGENFPDFHDISILCVGVWGKLDFSYEI